MELGKQRIREHAAAIIEAALQAVEPQHALLQSIQIRDNTLHLQEKAYPLNSYQKLYVLGAGKASGAMAAALEELLGDRITAGLVIVKEGYTAPTMRIEIVEAGHPIPTQAGVDATRRLIDLAQRAGPQDLVITLISGGGSALLTCPAAKLTLADLQTTTDALLRCGATINELNAVRKHLSRVKGGRLAQLAAPATLLTLTVSDVVGNPLDVIASGPTVPDTSTLAQAQAVLDKYQLQQALPAGVVEYLQHRAEETPKPGDPLFAKTHNVILASNVQAAEAAVHKAQQLGFNSLLLSTFIEGEAREVGKVMAGLAKGVRYHGHPLPAPACLIAGGESTVTINNPAGRGGRNQEMALAAALALQNEENVGVLCLATDGTDGPTEAAGAWADSHTVNKAASQGLIAADFLSNNDSYLFFRQLDDLIITGPTNTNVNDLIFIFVWESNENSTNQRKGLY